MTQHGQSWYDDAAGPLVRPYAVTRGRTIGAGHELDMLTLVVTADRAPAMRRAEPEYAEIIELCRKPMSVAEVSALLKLRLAVAKILVGDLISEGHLIFRAPTRTDAGPGDLTVLRAVLAGIRKL
jgi:hypothetical protein